MRKWTVLLLRPDYIAATYGQDTYLAHVKASNAKGALYAAQEDARRADDTENRDDYYCLLCVRGWHKDHSSGDGGVF